VPGKRVLEIGAGNSALLCYLARRFDGKARFSGLDYSEAGCRMLVRRAEREGATIEVIHQDLFAPAPDLLGQFDLVYSIGVAEHFSSLPPVLGATRQLLSPNGRMFTLIPNMAGILGTLTRQYNRAVYDLHAPHTMVSFLQGHDEAGLVVEQSGYLCSTNFGVISSCFRGETDRGWTTYKWLSRVTTLLWLMESKIGELPHTATFSPYLFTISRARPQ
jgi:SAM-dependent methyltransferase